MRLPNPLHLSLIFSSLSLDAAPPKEVGVALHPNGITNKCLDVQGGVFKDGTPVQIFDCNGTGAQKWVVDNCKKQVRVANTNFCLDATTSNPPVGTKLKIWQCVGNPAQTWFRTAGNQIALFGTNACVDAPYGLLSNGNIAQTYTCQAGNTNQLWSS